MDTTRRSFIRLTAAGLLYVSSTPLAGAMGNDEADLIRKAAERGHTDLGWLKSYHSFSFGRYYDQRHMGFRALRVINDDRISAGKGFPTHPHRDMEILSYVLDGALQHRDSTGQGSIVRPDDVQMMSAGTGITHSEYNPAAAAANHFLQVWIQPAQKGLRPRYQQQAVASADRQGHLRLIASPESRAGVVRIHQDAKVFATKLTQSQQVTHVVEGNRHVWLQVAVGSLTVNGTTLHAGDAVATSRPTSLHIKGIDQAEALLFDLA
jgi:redox-sensitive bicupin YhaK (pirin superfamily)